MEALYAQQERTRLRQIDGREREQQLANVIKQHERTVADSADFAADGTKEQMQALIRQHHLELAACSN